MYMSYCRFEGTRAELDVCLNEVSEHIYEEAEYDVSENEIKHFRRMVEDFVDWLKGSEILNMEGEVDQERLDEVCELMKKGNAEEY